MNFARVVKEAGNLAIILMCFLGPVFPTSLDEEIDWLLNSISGIEPREINTDLEFDRFDGSGFEYTSGDDYIDSLDVLIDELEQMLSRFPFPKASIMEPIR